MHFNDIVDCVCCMYQRYSQLLIAVTMVTNIYLKIHCSFNHYLIQVFKMIHIAALVVIYLRVAGI